MSAKGSEHFDRSCGGGTRVRQLARFNGPGLAEGRFLELSPLGKLVGLEERYRLVVPRADGSVYISTLPPRGRSGWPRITGQPTDGPGGVACAAMRARKPNSNHPIERGLETVYLLRPGARHVVPLHAGQLRFNPYWHGANLACMATSSSKAQARAARPLLTHTTFG